MLKIREEFMRKEEKKKLKKLYLILAIMIFLIIFIDQLSKVIVVHYEEITLIADKIVLKPAEIRNGMYDETSRGVTILTNLVIVVHYGEITLIADKIVLKPAEIQNGVYDETARGVNILTNLVIVGIILGIIKSDNQFITKKIKILLSLAFAGGVSNIIDRLCRGSVVEFIHIGNFPAFNIADVCILIGWVSFVAIFASFSAKELSNKREAKEKNTEDNPNKSV